jgi:uncharacterized membrane protein YfcA
MYAELAAIAAAGFAAGTVNTLGGGGSLITFPAMIAIGVSPLSANVTNTVGLFPGTIGGTLASGDALAGQGRRSPPAATGRAGGRCAGQGRRIARLLAPSLLGAIAGTILLLLTPGDTFEAIAPILIGASCLLLLMQPAIARRFSAPDADHSRLLAAALVAAGAYAAYFGSAVGILVLAVLTLVLDDTLKRLNAAKVVLTGTMNLVAAGAYALLAPVAWPYAATLMLASLLGGATAARWGQAIPANTLRIGIAISGLTVAAALAVRAIP